MSNDRGICLRRAGVQQINLFLVVQTHADAIFNPVHVPCAIAHCRSHRFEFPGTGFDFGFNFLAHVVHSSFKFPGLFFIATEGQRQGLPDGSTDKVGDEITQDRIDNFVIEILVNEKGGIFGNLVAKLDTCIL